VLDPDGLRNEVRSAIKTISFAPSKQVGYGREVTELGYITKLEDIDRFVVVNSYNIITKGYVDFWEVTKEDLKTLSLGKNKKMSAKKFWKIVSSVA
jgi:hypothetical protein